MPNQPKIEEAMQKSMKAAEGVVPAAPAVPQAPSVPQASAGAPVMPPSRKPKPMVGNVAEALSPKAAKQAIRQVEVKDTFDYDVAFNLAFIGAGQGGGRIADSFWRLGYRRVAVFNLTDSDFEGLDDTIPKHSLDVGGAAKDAVFAAAQIEGREEEVWDLMVRAWGNDAEYALVCVGLGGGSGSGTTPKIIEMARNYLKSKGKPPRVGAIVSLPTTSEGQQVCRNAVITFKKLLDMRVSPLIIIDNTRIHELYKPPMAQLHRLANDSVSQYLHLFNQLAAVHSEMFTFDHSELAQLLDSGIVVMGAATIGDVDTITSPADVSAAIRDELTNNVLAEVDLRQGLKGCCLFVASNEVLSTFSMDYFEAGFTQLDRLLGSARSGDVTPVLHRGLYSGDTQGLQAYTMIAGVDPPKKCLSELAKKAGLDRDAQRMGLAEFLGVDDAR